MPARRSGGSVPAARARRAKRSRRGFPHERRGRAFLLLTGDDVATQKRSVREGDFAKGLRVRAAVHLQRPRRGGVGEIAKTRPARDRIRGPEIEAHARLPVSVGFIARAPCSAPASPRAVVAPGFNSPGTSPGTTVGHVQPQAEHLPEHLLLHHPRAFPRALRHGREAERVRELDRAPECRGERKTGGGGSGNRSARRRGFGGARCRIGKSLKTRVLRRPRVRSSALARTCHEARGRRVPSRGHRARPPRAWRRRATRPSHSAACARVARGGRTTVRLCVFLGRKVQQPSDGRSPHCHRRPAGFRRFFSTGGAFLGSAHAVGDARFRSPRDGRAASSRRRRPGRVDPRGPRRASRAASERARPRARAARTARFPTGA